MSFFKCCSLLVGVCGLLAAGSTPASAEPLTFSAFGQKVLSNYPRLKQEDANVNAALARKMQAVSGFLPRLRGSSALTRGDDPVYVFGSLLRQDAFTSANFELPSLNTPRPQSNLNLTVSGEIPIFDAFQTIARVKMSRLELRSAELDRDFVRGEAYLVAAEAYLRALVIERTLATVEAVYADSRQDVQQAEDLKEKGMILGADYFAAKVVYGGIERVRNELAQKRLASHIALNILMGEDPLSPVSLSGDLPEGAAAQKTLPQWFEAAYASRPDLLSLEKTVKAREVDVTREKATALPDVRAFGSAQKDRHGHNDGENYVVGVKGELALWDPSYGPRVRASREDLKRWEQDIVILRDRITGDLADEFTQGTALRENAGTVEAMFSDAQQAVSLMLPLYREGRKSIVDLMEIRFAYLGAASEYYRSRAEQELSSTRLFFLSGTLDDAAVEGLAERMGL